MSITLDDAFPDHPKVLPLSDAAFRLLVKTWCYAKRHRTGGLLRTGVVERLYPKRAKALIAELVLNRLLEPLSEGGFQIHDWADWWNEDQLQAESYKEELNQRRRALSFKRSSAGKARAAAAQRDGDGKFVQQPLQQTASTLASTEASTPPAPSSTPPPAHAGSNGQQTPANSDVWSSSKPSTQPAPSRPRVGTRTDARGSDPDPDPNREDLRTTGAEDLKDLSTRASESEQRQQQPTNLEEALQIPIGERSKLCTKDPHFAQYLQPEEWPEIRKIAATLGEALGQPVFLAAYHRDSGVRAVVELFAAGFTEADLAEAARANEAWWRKEKRGLSSLTPEVVRRALAQSLPPEHTDVRPRTKLEQKLLDEAKQFADAERAKAAQHGK